ncbi:MAG: homocysteine S-methyltransferase family protein [Oscillospiraceae bacterium]|nr:homocysteine S-methyltransferase family protein [Oscillospiraceae bacterium]
MGTMLQQSGLNAGENPMCLNITNPDLITQVHRQYVAAGSDILLTNTFGTNRQKLHGTGYPPGQIIHAAVSAARQAAARQAAGADTLVALDVGPIGELLAPLGTLTFDDAYDLFREQVEAGRNAGVDLVFIETMADLNEVRAAILAVKECSDLPIFVTMTFQPDGRTFTGCLPESFAMVAGGLGADALGINCSTGPREMRDVVARIVAATDLPVIVKPNAGLPDPATGIYDLSPAEFAAAVAELTALGVSVVGGCCGTSPAYITALKDQLAGANPIVRQPRARNSMVCSAVRTVEISGVQVIGERINPTGKREFRQALIEGNLDYILAQAISQEVAGADLLDVNVGVPELDEPAQMARIVPAIQSVTGLPLVIDSSNPDALEAGLRAYCGKAVVNSISGEQAALDRILPLVKQYGASVVGLTLDEQGIPETAEGRLEIARRILNAALAHGIPREDVFIDCLTLTVSAQPQGATETRKAVRMVRQELGLQAVLGVSNISFGLPNRPLINQTFLTMALEAGLTLPICNPNDQGMMDAIAAFRLLALADPGGASFIARFSAQEAAPVPVAVAGNQDITYAICKGLRDEARSITASLLETWDEVELVQTLLIPALDQVGQRFEAGELFLPQLLNAAGAAGGAFDLIKERLTRRGAAPLEKGTIVLATVAGDIHDIGKNIVKVILENYGYRVIDLGKDVPPEQVVEAVVRENIRLVGLSALMTTTLGSMADTITRLKSAGCACKIMVGGAVLTPEYAQEIGADYYARDAKDGVACAREVFGA